MANQSTGITDSGAKQLKVNSLQTESEFEDWVSEDDDLDDNHSRHSQDEGLLTQADMA